MADYRIGVFGGGKGIGKSALVFQLAHQRFGLDPGFDEAVNHHVTIDGEASHLQIWDACGFPYDHCDNHDEEMKLIRICRGFLCTYSVTCRASFEHMLTLYDWIARVHGKKMP